MKFIDIIIIKITTVVIIKTAKTTITEVILHDKLNVACIYAIARLTKTTFPDKAWQTRRLIGSHTYLDNEATISTELVFFVNELCIWSYLWKIKLSY